MSDIYSGTLNKLQPGAYCFSRQGASEFMRHKSQLLDSTRVRLVIGYAEKLYQGRLTLAYYNN